MACPPKLRLLWVGFSALLLIWISIDVLHRARLDPHHPTRHQTDLTVYTEAGAAFFDGRQPYEVSNVRGWRYLYPPLFAIVLAPLHTLDSRLQAAIWLLVSCGFGYGLFVEVRHVLRHVVRQALLANHRESPPGWIVGPAMLATLLASIAVLQRGQADLILSYALWLGLRLAWIDEHWPAWLLAGISLALPVSIKLTPIVPVGFLCLQLILLANHNWPRARQRALGVSAGFAAGLLLWFAVVPSLFVGWRANLAHLATWRDRVVVVTATDSPPGGMDRRSYRNQSLSNAAYRVGNYLAYRLGRGPDDRWATDKNPRVTLPMDHPGFLKAILLIDGLVLVMLLWAGWRLTVRSELGGLAAFGLACSATLLLSPVSWHYHYVLWLPALLFVPLWLYAEGRDRAAAAMAWIPCGLTVGHHALLGIAGRLGLLGLGHAGWFFAAVALAFSARPRRAETECEMAVPPITLGRDH